MQKHASKQETITSPMGTTAFPFYLGGIASWFLALGLQTVMLPTIGLVYLNNSPFELAILQMAQMAPALVLLLFIGGLSDRLEGRTLLAAIHTVAAIPPAILGWMVWNGTFTYTHLLIFALLMGCLSAFSVPTRDALLTRIVQSNVQKAVTFSLMAQFSAQLIGFSLAAVFSQLAGAWALLVMQSIGLLVGLAFSLALPRLPPQAAPPDSTPQNWRTGLDIVFNSPRLFPILLVTFAVSTFFIGTFVVGLPLIARNVFGGGQLEISLLSLSFWVGTITITIILSRLPPIHRRGLALTFSTFGGALCLMGIGFASSFPIMCAAVACWGLCAGINIAMSRTVMQIEAPAHAKARVMAIYNFAFLGGMPFGALTTGLVSEKFGAQTSVMIFSAAMMLFLIWMFFFTDLRRVTRHPDEV